MVKKVWWRPRVGPVLCATALLYAPTALALGLGQLVVESNLGQPLRAEVPLLAFHAPDRSVVKVRLGSSAAFAAAGIRKDRALKSVICRIHRKADGRYVVLLNSRRVIDVPFLHFILKVKGPNGSLLREYTALLNPVSGVQTVSRRLPSGGRARPYPSVFRMKVARRLRVAGGVLHVQPGQNLWVLAAPRAPSRATMPQTLEAFLHANPGAFFGHNVNNLRAGAVLRIPSRRAILSVPAAHAAHWLRAQDQAWGQYRRVLAAAPVSTGVPARSIGGVLRHAQVLPPTHPLLQIEAAHLPAGSATIGAGPLTGPAAGVATRMAVLRNELRKTRQLITLDNQELAVLEREAAATPAAVHAQGPIAAGAMRVAPIVAKPTIKKPPLVIRPKRPVVVRPLPAAPAAPSFLSMLATDTSARPLLLGLLALVAAGGLLYYRQRRRSMAEFEESILSGGGGLNSEGQMSDTAGLPKTPEASFLSEFSQAGGVVNMHTDEVDPMAEADVYLAYGRDEQAEEILKEAITKDADRLELKLKLLEIYFQRHDLKTFEIVAEELYATSNGKGPVWQKAEEMGYRLDPTNPLFKRGARLAGSPTVGLDPEITPEEGALSSSSLMADRIDFAAVARELDAVSGPSFGGAAPPSSLPSDGPLFVPAEPAEGEENALDFSTGLGADEAVAGATAPTEIAPKTTANTLDFSWNDANSGAVAPSPAGEEFALQFDDEDIASLSAADLNFTVPGESRAPSFLPANPHATEEEGDLVIEAEADSIDSDAIETKLALARAYQEMGDTEGARSILDEVLAEGNEQQRHQARELAS
ncbi:MAG: FimV/HubP family polar landmark protein [Acidiferrobacter sp.]